MMNEFVDWHKKNEVEIGEVMTLMSLGLSDEPEELIRDLIKIEGHNARVGYLLAEANSWLDKASFFQMPPREGRTEMERKAFVESAVAPIRMVRDTLESLSDAIKQRLIFGESCLSYHRQYFQKNNAPLVMR